VSEEKSISWFRGGRYCLFLGLLLLTNQSGVTATSNPIYRLKWNVAPTAGNDVFREYKPGDEVLRLPLQPLGLFETTDDIVENNGDLLIPKGQQVVQIVSDAKIACTIHSVKKNGLESIGFFGSLKRICLYDSNVDGLYDQRFLRATNYPAYFLLRGRLSGGMKEIRPTKLESISPDKVFAPPRVALKLKASEKSERFALVADVGGDWSPFNLIDGLSGKTSQLPQSFEFYGGIIDVKKSPSGRFLIRTRGTFSAQDLDFWD
jgi:hypothetical protein